MIDNEKVYALQNKFPGAGTSNGDFWGQVSTIKTDYFTGMMFIYGKGNEGPLRVRLENETQSLEVTDYIADILLGEVGK